MINTTNNYKTAIKAAKRHLKAKVELYSGSSLVNTYTQNDALKSVTIDRVGEESKFFGFGVSHKFNIKLIDVARAINLTTDNYFKIYLGTEDEYITYPKAHITEVNRDENTNELSITAYDVLKDTKTATVSDLGLQAPYTIQDVVKASSELLGCNKYIKESKNLFNLDTSLFPRSSNDGELTATLNDNGSVNIVGTKTTTTWTTVNMNLATPIKFEAGKTYTLPFVLSCLKESDGTWVGNKGGTITPDENWICRSAYWQTNVPKEYDITIYPMVIEGTGTIDESTYEPYYKTEVIYTGKNSWDNSQVVEVSDYVFPNETGFKIVRTANGRISPEYDISLDVGTYKTLGEFSDFLRFYTIADDGTLTYFKVKNNTIFNIEKKVNKIVFYMLREEENGTYVEVKDFMITNDITATEYEPYNTAFEIEYTDGANFEGTETLEEALRAAAEATQTIYYVNSNDNLIFKRLGGTAASITKDNYITLDSKTNKRLQTICSATELGDNVSASTSLVGSIQYLRDNPFLELREDIATILDNAIAAVGNMSINQFSCEWRGDPSLEVGDKLELTTKDNNKVISYLLNDSLTYEGGLKQKTQWNYTDSEEAESTPTKLGEALKQTRAKVDKVNKEITLLVSETSANTEQISGLTTRASGIEATVSEMKTTQETTSSTLETINNDITTLTNTVNAKVSAEDVKIEIQKEMSNGATSVKTTTGFTFDDNGLTIAKDGSEMTTNVDEDGISVYRDSEEVLTANNEGVVAYDLHAKTYLIVGTNSRFEDYEKDGEPRTGCFWIGETEVE